MRELQDCLATEWLRVGEEPVVGDRSGELCQLSDISVKAATIFMLETKKV